MRRLAGWRGVTLAGWLAGLVGFLDVESAGDVANPGAGKKEQGIQSSEGTNPDTRHALAVTMIRRLWSSGQWRAGLNFAPDTEIRTAPR